MKECKEISKKGTIFNTKNNKKGTIFNVETSKKGTIKINTQV